MINNASRPGARTLSIPTNTWPAHTPAIVSEARELTILSVARERADARLATTAIYFYRAISGIRPNGQNSIFS